MMMTNLHEPVTVLDTTKCVLDVNKNFSTNVLKQDMQTSGSHGAKQWKGNI
jgi:hypothetical protein